MGTTQLKFEINVNGGNNHQISVNGFELLIDKFQGDNTV
jgi:hypothetical protein